MICVLTLQGKEFIIIIGFCFFTATDIDFIWKGTQKALSVSRGDQRDGWKRDIGEIESLFLLGLGLGTWGAVQVTYRLAF